MFYVTAPLGPYLPPERLRRVSLPPQTRQTRHESKIIDIKLIERLHVIEYGGSGFRDNNRGRTFILRSRLSGWIAVSPPWFGPDLGSV